MRQNAGGDTERLRQGAVLGVYPSLLSKNLGMPFGCIPCVNGNKFN